MGKYHCTIELLFDWLGISSMTTDDFCFYLQNRLIQTSQTGGQWYSDTFPLSIPWREREKKRESESESESEKGRESGRVGE
jgi:hypothetical protein